MTRNRPTELAELPPRNPRALGLHLTDAEWRALRVFVEQEPRIKRVLIYGSRRTGVRRPKPVPGPPDIDLGVELAWPNSLGGTIELGAAVKERWQEYWVAHGIQVDWHGCGAASDAYRVDALEIFPG